LNEKAQSKILDMTKDIESKDEFNFSKKMDYLN
jgi:hypothetical protein